MLLRHSFATHLLGCRHRSAQHPASARSPRSRDHLSLSARLRKPGCTLRRAHLTICPFATSTPHKGREQNWHEPDIGLKWPMSSTHISKSSFSAGAMLFDQQRKVLRDIGLFAAQPHLGTHLERCDRCSCETVCSTTWCRNRHCPQVVSLSARDQLAPQAGRKPGLPGVPYAHVAFTVPEQLAPLAFQEPAPLLQPSLFRAGPRRPCFRDRRRSTPSRCTGIGVLAVLHTWESEPPHIILNTCIVSSPPADWPPIYSRWAANQTPRDIFSPVRVLSRMFRGKLLTFLKQSYRRGELRFAGRAG